VEDFEAVHPSARSTMREALATIRSLGVRWRRIALPALAIDSVARTIIRAEGSAVFEDLIRSGRVAQLEDRRQQIGLRAGLQVLAADYLRAMRIRRLLQEAFGRIFREVDVILAPTRLVPAPGIDEPLDPEWRPGRPGGSRTGRGRTRRPGGGGSVALVPAGNLAGLPALALPCGFTAAGLPLGVQLVGRPFEEATLIELGRAYQTVTSWHRRTPPISEEAGRIS
jgi:aspartyl-tRNA(Asn)/glutamyl-tRNA(Gln) amidotransferase subunit A